MLRLKICDPAVVLLLLNPLELKQSERKEEHSIGVVFFCRCLHTPSPPADCTKFARTHDKIFKTANEHRSKLHHVFPDKQRKQEKDSSFLSNLIQFLLVSIELSVYIKRMSLFIECNKIMRK